MSKKSKPCSYTGHMHTMNRIDVEKKSFDSVTAQKAKLDLQSPRGVPVKHKNKDTDVALPQEQHKESPCKACK